MSCLFLFPSCLSGCCLLSVSETSLADGVLQSVGSWGLVGVASPQAGCKVRAFSVVYFVLFLSSSVFLCFQGKSYAGEK